MKKLLLLAPLAIILALVSLILFFPLSSQDQYSLSQTGLVTYKLSIPQFSRSPLPDGSEKIIFESRGERVYSLYQVPGNSNKPSGTASDMHIRSEVFPAFIVLPGGNVKKEAEHSGIAKDLRSLGFATITLDQRGVGETGGPFPPMDQEFLSFQNKNEPVNHKMVADALEAFALLETFPEIDKNKIYIAGVSMGGRVAIISAANQPKIKGVLAVSTGGFSYSGLPQDQKSFLDSINPNLYVSQISPRPLIMIHSENDTIVPIQEAQFTFSLAREPKSFYIAGEGHGYYSAPHFSIIQSALSNWR